MFLIYPKHKINNNLKLNFNFKFKKGEFYANKKTNNVFINGIIFKFKSIYLCTRY